MGKTKYQPIAYTLRIHGKGPKYRYVDVITKLAQLQISYLVIVKSSKFENSLFYNKFG